MQYFAEYSGSNVFNCNSCRKIIEIGTIRIVCNNLKINNTVIIFQF